MTLGAKEKPGEEWLSYERLAREAKQRACPEFRKIRVLVVTDCGSPDARQRHVPVERV